MLLIPLLLPFLSLLSLPPNFTGRPLDAGHPGPLRLGPVRRREEGQRAGRRGQGPDAGEGADERERKREAKKKTIAPPSTPQQLTLSFSPFRKKKKPHQKNHRSPPPPPPPHPTPPHPNQIRALAAQSPAFAAFLKDRSVAKSAKGKQLEAILSDLKAADLTKNFMSLLAANNRLSEISRVAATFGSLVAHSRGQVTATVTTADPLSADEAEEIRKGLSEVLPKGKTLQLSTRVDASIIGGVVVDIGDKHIDLSIASRVKQVEQLIAAGLN